MSDSSFTFIFDGECPFCNHFAELLELKSKVKNLSILDARKNEKLVKELLNKGFDIDQGAVLLTEDKIFHGHEAINKICNQIISPSSKLLKMLTMTFKSSKRTKLIFPFLVTARRFALISKGVSTRLC